MTLSNDGWRRAAIIAGMPEAEAGAAAERNLKAHFGEA
jgi:predicted transcriptional regulator